MSKIEIISSLKDYGGCVMDVADEMKDRISTLESTNDIVVSTSNLLKEEVEQLKKHFETAKHDNYQLKNTIESLMNLTVAVPYEKVLICELLVQQELLNSEIILKKV